MVKQTPLKAHHSRALGEVRHVGVLPCGMRLLFAPRPGFTKKLAFVVADYGSTDSAWKRDGRRLKVPDGIAHFLEHQMFKKARGDLSDVFSERGANVNAHTSHTQTAYYFECVENFEANLDTLLELALTPFFDPGLVDIERDIIIQEINQYRDHPGWVGFQQLLEAMYAKHPLRIDIAGTAETVGEVTPENLALCHATFYHPSNLTLLITGDLDPTGVYDEAARLSDKWAPRTPAPGFERERPREPRKVARRKSERRMFIARPRLMLGFKDAGRPAGDELTRQDMLATLALDAMFSRESEVVEALYNEGLIGRDFGAGYEAEPGFGYAVIGGETPDPAKLESRLTDAIRRARRDGVDEAVLERKRRKFIGGFLRAFNEPESTAYSYLGAIGQGSELFDVPGMVRDVTVDQVNQCIKDLLTPDNYAVSLLLPQ